MRAPAPLRLALAALALAATAGVASAEDAPLNQKLHFRNVGADCATGTPFLANAPGTGDINCGYIGGGLPFGEVFKAADLGAERVFSTPASEEEVPPVIAVLDATRDLTARIVVQAGSQQGQALPGVGQIVVDLVLSGTDAEGNTVDLGTQTKEVLATPPARTVEVPFTFGLADALQGKQLTSVTASLTTRGVHLFHGFAQMNTSALTLPVLPLPTA